MNSNTDKFNNERLSAANLADAEKLHSIVYGKTPPKGLFAKKYDTAFTGAQYTGFIAYHEGSPIAFYAVIPCFMKFDDKIVLAAQSADTMTHPQYRNKGLFVELALLTFQACREDGVSFVFGFPNQNSLPGFVNNLGGHTTETMDYFVIPSGSSPVARLFRKLSSLKLLYDSYRESLLKKYRLAQNGIANSVLKDGHAGVYRDEHFLNYKTYNSTRVIKIGNAIIWFKITGMLLIGDMDVNAQDFDEAITGLKRIAKKLGIGEIHFHVSPGTALHKLFADRFTSTPSFPHTFKDLACDAPLNKIKFTSADIDTF